MNTKFILKNKWTEGSVRVEKAVGTRIDVMESVVGSGLEYLNTQEHGGFKVANPTSDSAPIATSYAAGQTGKRTKLPLRGMALRQIKQVWKGSGRNETIRNQAALREGMKSRTKKPFRLHGIE